MFGTRSSMWGSFAKIGSPLRVFAPPTTQQLLPMADRFSERSRPDISGLGVLNPSCAPAGNWFCAVLRLKSFPSGMGGFEPESPPSSGVSREETLGAKNSKAFCGKVLFKASRASSTCPGLSCRSSAIRVDNEHAVLRSPLPRFNAKQIVLERLRLELAQPKIYSICIGFEKFLFVFLEGIKFVLGSNQKAVNTCLTVRWKSRLSENLGELSGSASTQDIHLKETILRMNKAGCIGNIFSIFAANRGYTQRVAFHFHRSRDPAPPVEGSSLLPLPNPYIVPGGRFREVYYWDSYFTMLGLKESGEVDLIEDIVKNFASLINRYGFIPNGNRTYYLSRSQPPYFSMMVEVLAGLKGHSIYVDNLSALEKSELKTYRGELRKRNFMRAKRISSSETTHFVQAAIGQQR